MPDKKVSIQLFKIFYVFVSSATTFIKLIKKKTGLFVVKVAAVLFQVASQGDQR